MKIVSFTGGGWYHADFVPDGSNTFDITAASLRANIVGGPDGIAFVPPGSPVFPSNSVLIALYGLGKVVTAPLDANGDPILANAQDVLQQLGHADGACMDPVTGDFLFGSFNAQGQLIRVSGFEAPTPTPTATVTPTPAATATATPSATATAKTNATQRAVALASITLNPGNRRAPRIAPVPSRLVPRRRRAVRWCAGEQQDQCGDGAGLRDGGCRRHDGHVHGRHEYRDRRHGRNHHRHLRWHLPISRARREHAAGFLDDEPFRS